MNLLAHAILSPSDEKVRLGNVLADFIGRKERIELDPQVQAGIELHQKIDTFTDSHIVVDRSKARLVGFQRFGNALVDVFYDHFLTKNWSHDLPVSEFVNNLYGSILRNHGLFPESCVQVSNRMIEQNWLNSYSTVEGLRLNLTRMELRIQVRTGRTIDLVSSLSILEENYRDFESDFVEFWPQLRQHIDENYRFQR